MARWNPNLYLREGREKEYAEEYLQALTNVGKSIDTNEVPVVFSLSHLAHLSRTLYQDLYEVVARANLKEPDYPYRSFTIRKRSGGVRWISVPFPPLKAVQSWIADNILRRVPLHEAARAYGSGRKIIDHAAMHCGSKWLIKVDIKDFFSNISERQVFQVFLKLGYPRLLSFEMARLCTRVTPRRLGARWRTDSWHYGIRGYRCAYVGSLPQGAPTSPALSNLVCEDMDDALAKLALDHGATYSRYADDLCFSLVDGTRENARQCLSDIAEVLWKNSFEVNYRKTRVIPPGSRKILTGLIVDDKKPTVPREIRDRVKMHLYFAEKLGIPAHCKKRGFKSVIGFRNHLHGLITYINSVDATHGSRLFEKYNALPWLQFNL